MYDLRLERQAAMFSDRRSLRGTLMVTLGLLALGPACSPRCEAATEALEPLADHLPVPAFTADHQTWLNSVLEQLPVLTKQLAAMPTGSEPSKVARSAPNLFYRANWRSSDRSGRAFSLSAKTCTWPRSTSGLKTTNSSCAKAPGGLNRLHRQPAIRTWPARPRLFS